MPGPFLCSSLLSLALVVGGYLGINAYAYVFGGSEHRVCALLGLLSALILVLFPALAARPISVDYPSALQFLKG